MAKVSLDLFSHETQYSFASAINTGKTQPSIWMEIAKTWTPMNIGSLKTHGQDLQSNFTNAMQLCTLQNRTNLKQGQMDQPPPFWLAYDLLGVKQGKPKTRSSTSRSGHLQNNGSLASTTVSNFMEEKKTVSIFAQKTDSTG